MVTEYISICIVLSNVFQFENASFGVILVREMCIILHATTLNYTHDMSYMVLLQTRSFKETESAVRVARLLVTKK